MTIELTRPEVFDSEITSVALRRAEGILPVNREMLDPVIAQAIARRSLKGQNEMLGNMEKAIAEHYNAYAQKQGLDLSHAQYTDVRGAGEPGLLDQQRPNYVTHEALVRSFAPSFGIVELGGAANQIPEFTTLTPDDVKIITTVAVTAGAGTVRRRKQYKVVEAQTTTKWLETATETVEVPFVNPFFPRKRAIVEAQANDKMAYAMRKNIDNIILTTVQAQLFTSLPSSVFTFRDTSVLGIPTSNDQTSSYNFWRTLRQTVIPFFQGVNKADRVLNVHVLHTDLQYLWQTAPIGSQALGHYTAFQEKVYEGNIMDIVVYGHRFRIIPENYFITTGQLYVVADPTFKMWLPPDGSLVRRVTRDDGATAMNIHRVYAILAPVPWAINVLRSTWSTADISNG